MRNIVAIDQGNSRVKASFVCIKRNGFDVIDQILWATHKDSSYPGELPEYISRHNVSKGIYASTCGIDSKLTDALQEHLPEGLLTLTPHTPLPIKVNYGTPETLGADRLAAAVGADKLFPGRSMLVVDTGTCMTLDILNDGKFLGGNISPGLQMRLDAMHHFTGALPKLTAPRDHKIPFIGHDTQTALLSGATSGITAEISKIFEIGKVIYGLEKIVLTGGNADMFDAILSKHFPIENIPNLVSLGLTTILLHNEKI